jgi:ABC-type uncharacterized transport system substrate-binding protein
VRRREFIAIVSAGLVLPMITRAQQPTRVYRVGFVSSIGTAYIYPLNDPRAGVIRPFAEGLRELGYVEGQNLVLLRRSAEGVVGRGTDIASVLIREGVDVIVVTTVVLAKEMMGATTTVPIVMAAGGDPIRTGVAANLARPGGNVTGFTIIPGPEFHAKRLQYLKDTIPNTSRVAYLATRGEWDDTTGKAIRFAAMGLGVTLTHAEHTLTNYTDAFALMAKERPDALVVSANPAANPKAIIDFASEHRMPAIYPWRQYVLDGGLMSYGIDLQDQYHRSAGYVDRILKGENPAELPIQQPTKFELVVNLKTAKAIGVEIPAPVLAQAAEVIE